MLAMDFANGFHWAGGNSQKDAHIKVIALIKPTFYGFRKLVNDV